MRKSKSGANYIIMHLDSFFVRGTFGPPRRRHYRRGRGYRVVFSMRKLTDAHVYKVDQDT